MKKVKDNRKLTKYKNLEDNESVSTNTLVSMDESVSELPHIRDEYIVEDDSNIKDESDIEDELDIENKLDIEEISPENKTKEIPNAGFPPLRLKKKNINASNKERFFQSNIRDILLINKTKNIIKDNNDTELEIINSL